MKSFTLLRFLFAYAWLAALPIFSFAQTTYCVRAGATGANNGSDWNNAYTTLPATLQRGATYLIADGNYGAYTFDDVESGSTYIYITKATPQTKGDKAGWSDAYGDGEAVFSSGGDTWRFLRGYYDINGVVGTGKAPKTYGFRLTSTGSRGTNISLASFRTNRCDNVKFRYIEFDWDNGTGTSANAVTRAWDGGSATQAPNNGTLFQSCYVHHSSGFAFFQNYAAENYTIEKSYFYRNGGGGGEASHWETFWNTGVTNLTFRNNVVDDTIGVSGQTGWFMIGACTNVKIYGNVFMGSSAQTSVGNNGVIATWSNDDYKNDNVSIINNTFVDLNTGVFAVPVINFYHNSANDSNVICKNNLYYNGNFGWNSIDSQSHEAFGGGNGPSGSNAQTNLSTGIFLSYSADNFQLSGPTSPGDSSVGAEYAIDANGRTRGADGVWDRGAFEYSGGPDTSKPIVSNITVTDITTTSAKINWATNEGSDSRVDYGITSTYGSNVSNPAVVTSHSVALTGLSSGQTYNFRVQSTDASNNQAQSANQIFATLAPDTTPPTVTLTNPTSGSGPISGNISLTATANDNVGISVVEFRLGSTVLNSDSSFPYAFSWNSTSVANGNYVISAVARDAVLNERMSSVNVTVQNGTPTDTMKPTVLFTSPANNANVSANVNLVVTASDNVGVTSVVFSVDGTPIHTDTSSPYSYSWNSGSVANGAHSITATARDAANNESTATLPVNVQNTDAQAPSVTLTAPTNSATISNVFTLTATATDNVGVASVEFRMDGTTVYRDSTVPYSFDWDSTGVPNGTHAITAVARDAANNTAENGVSVTVNNTIAPPAGGLVGYWKFDENAGTVAADSSGNNGNGTLLNGTTRVAGRVGKAIALDGVDDYVRIPSTAILEATTNAVTVCSWVKLENNGQWQAIVRKVLAEGSHEYPYAAYDLIVEGTGTGATTMLPRMAVSRQDGIRAVVYGTTGLAFGQWYHVAGVYNGSTLRIFVNGVQQNSTPFTGTLAQTGQPLLVGRNGAGGDLLKGQLDELKVYSRVLSDTEIMNLYKAVPTAPTGIRVMPE